MRNVTTIFAAIALMAVCLGASSEDYGLGPDSLPQEGVPQGTVTQHTWNDSTIYPGTERDYWVYVPAQYDAAKPTCVMVFQDGGNYVKPEGDARVATVFDNLIHQKAMPVTIGIFINPGKGPQRQRSIEYDTLSDTYTQFLLQEILPAVGADYNLTDDPEGRAICGISSGGICAFTVAWEHPEAFHKVVSHVGSFTNLRGGHVYPSLIRKTKGDPKPIRVFLQDGENDLNNDYGNWWLSNLQMESALEYAGYDYTFVGGTGGHSLKHGGAIMPDALRWIWRDYLGVVAAVQQP